MDRRDFVSSFIAFGLCIASDNASKHEANKEAKETNKQDANKQKTEFIVEIPERLMIKDVPVGVEQRIFDYYMDNVIADCNNTTVYDKYLQRLELPNERAMRAVECELDISEQAVFDFRRNIVSSCMGYIMKHKKRNVGVTIPWDFHPELAKAIKQFCDKGLHTMTPSAEILEKYWASQKDDK